MFSKKVSDAVEVAGSSENVQLWIFWTPHQLNLLEAQNLNRLALLSSYSTGKTIMMIDKAKSLASADQNCKVLFVVVNDGPSLLQFRLEEVFKHLKNVTVLNFKKPFFLEDLESWLVKIQGFDHLFIDEFAVPQAFKSKFWNLLASYYRRSSFRVRSFSVKRR